MILRLNNSSEIVLNYFLEKYVYYNSQVSKRAKGLVYSCITSTFTLKQKKPQSPKFFPDFPTFMPTDGQTTIVR